MALLTTACTASASAEHTIPVTQLGQDIDAYLRDPALADVRSVIVVAGDRTVFEKYYDSSAEESRNVFSVTKSVLSTLVGIAVDDGLLDIHQTLAELLPAYADRMTPAVAGTTLEQLLTMTGGFSDTSSGTSVFDQPDVVAACLQSQGRPPGERFAYADAGAHLIAAILTQATGRSVLDYAREKLFGPLGVDTDPAVEPRFSAEGISAYEAADFAWPVDPQGINTGAFGLKLHPRDMARLGELFLHDGRWNGHQVVSKAWVQNATRAHVPAGGAANDYGYLWWVGEADGSPAFMAVGYGGQLIEVVPDRDLVVVVASEVAEHATVDHSVLAYLVDHVIAPLLGG
jgi:CubicO group peptidase (beta-lactamase class C family)